MAKMARTGLSRVLNRLGRELIKASRLLCITPQEKSSILWSRDNGDMTLRLEYPLDHSSTVFDLGGYEGQWTSDIFSKYCCFIYVFEPVEEFAVKIGRRFSKNNKIFVHRCGLSDLNKESKIFIDGDHSSTFKSKGEGKAVSEKMHSLRAVDFMKEHKIQSIDLMKINIEGGEYELLEHLLDSGFIENITNIQVQFHAFVPNAEERMMKIQQELAKTHFLTYQYLFVWENWQKKQ